MGRHNAVTYHSSCGAWQQIEFETPGLRVANLLHGANDPAPYRGGLHGLNVSNGNDYGIC